MVYLAIFSAIFLVWLCITVLANRFSGQAEILCLKVRGNELVPLQGHTEITITSWNLGYGGLGSKSDFVADGGKSFLPESKKYVMSNVEGIRQTLTELNSDLSLFQEFANASILNRGVDLQALLLEDQRDKSSVFSPDLRTRLLPYPLNLEVGTATLSRFKIVEASAWKLPLESYFFGCLRKNYRMLVCRFAMSGTEASLVVVNVHLAAFDTKAKIRVQQLKRVVELATSEYEAGNFVVVGGDWNLRLSRTNFTHNTEQKYLFWLADFPQSVVPQGWNLVADSQVPSVRTVHKKYDAGDNYTCVIDGYLLSPNMKLVSISTKNCKFQHSDHNPVSLTVRCE